MLQSDWFLPVKDLFPVLPDTAIMKQVMGIGFGNGLENFLFKSGKLILSGIIATLGTTAIAANSVATTVGNFGWEMVGALGSVMMIVVAQCVGAGNREQTSYYIRKILTVGLCMMLTLFGGIFLLRNQIVLLFAFEPQVQAVCADYIGLMCLITVLGMHCFVFIPKNAMRAAGDIKFTIIVSVAAMFAVRVGLGYVLCVVFKMGLTGIWLAMGADFLVESVCNLHRLRSGKWMKKKLI